MRSGLIIGLLLFVVAKSPAQFIFSQIPQDLQMIPRDSDNIGRFNIAGKCFNPSIQSVRIKLVRDTDGVYLKDEVIPLDQQAMFSGTLGVPAMMADYNLLIYSINALGIHVLEKEVKKLVSGDYFIVAGQSNAIGPSELDSIGLLQDRLYTNRYCRTIGTVFEYANSIDPKTGKVRYTIQEDQKYFTPSSIYYASGCIGVWPLRMMSEIIRNTHVPICILNGGKGSTFIEDHFASNTPSDPNRLQLVDDTILKKKASPYDRLYKKLVAHGVTSAIKGIFWYQGESDGALSDSMAATYNQRFGILRNSWKLDYPNLERIFLFQINAGCGGKNTGLIRDQQRKLTELFNDVVVVPTVGSGETERLVEGCHYSPYGYNKLGEIMAPVVLKHLYHFNLKDKDIMGPRIKRVYYDKPLGICLEFDMDVAAQASQYFTFQNKGTAYLKDYFFKENEKQINIRSVKALNNKVYLDLIDTGEVILKLTYLPDVFSNIPTIYMGPWIVNKNNYRLGALTFYEYPVSQYTEIKLKKARWHDSDSLIIFPNPANGFINIDLDNIEASSISMWDATGIKVMELELEANQKIVSVDTSPYESGVYVLVFILGKGTYHKKVIVRNPN